MNDRLKTALMWALALLIVASCGLSAVLVVQDNVHAAQLEWGTVTALWQEATRLDVTTTRILATTYAQQTQGR